jgi:hypothetical protein
VENEPIIVTLYSKKGDPESVEIIKWIEELTKTDEFKLVNIYPEEGKDYQGKFEDQMPYVQVGPYQLRPPISKANLEIALKASLDRHKQLLESRNDQYLQRVDRGRNYSRTDKNTMWITRHYMFLINTLLFLYIAIPFLAPVFMKIGWETAGRSIYTVYKPL